MLSFVRALATLRSNRLSCLADACEPHCVRQVVDVETGIPEVERTHLGEVAHRLSI